MINNGQWSIMFNVVISCDLRVGCGAPTQPTTVLAGFRH